MNKPIAQVWTFRSDSNPDTEYQTLQYTDGSTSCDCKGWTRRVAGGARSCKHTRMVEMGLADRRAVSTHRYDTPSQNTPAVAPTQRPLPLAQLGQRKLALT